MRVLAFIAILALVGCHSTETHLKARASVEDMRGFPIDLCFEEIITRTWTQAPGETIGLLDHETFEIINPEPLEVLVARFGVIGSNRTVCVEFYVCQAAVNGETFSLLCHDQHPPAYNTRVTYEEQQKRSFFNVEGQDEDPGQQIKALEDEIGQCLLERQAHSIRFTPVGETMLREARDLLQQADRVLERVRSSGRGLRLRVGYAPSLAAGMLSVAVGGGGKGCGVRGVVSWKSRGSTRLRGQEFVLWEAAVIWAFGG
jgi:hypothetical protein